MSLLQTPYIGQRWMVDTDASLGLGIITQCEVRTITVEFAAVAESRVYSLDNAPLTRVLFEPGESVLLDDGQTVEIQQVQEIENIALYMGEKGEWIPETRLSPTLTLNNPIKRLFAGQLDAPTWLDLRSQFEKQYHNWRLSGQLGLQGARIQLTPHQLYVASAATDLEQVRVLLADEVGLGKTIEAGLILQRLLLQERAQRVLILVPEALQVQWFVELLRRFAIHAVLWNELTDINESRVFIVPHEALVTQTNLNESPWDLIIVDETHHFDLESGRSESDLLKLLGSQCLHLLLLTATPERIGLQEHFSRLQLLDAPRFDDFKSFQEKENQYANLASILGSILDSLHTGNSLSNNQWEQLFCEFPQLRLNESDIKRLDNEGLISFLLDCYGTGRVVFRNTRQAISGFPQRQLIKHPLADDENAKKQWLLHFLQENKSEKALLISHKKADVVELREWLYRKTGIDCPVFHEGMSLVERDRAAAYFADDESGAPVLLCSEIGSEGRNFQFCHHLICWDLPEHPDVLEQRIGRLDRIGQQQTIKIHVCVDNQQVEQHLMWYHDVLQCIEEINPVAGIIHKQYYQDYLQAPEKNSEKAKKLVEEKLQEIHQGRNRLLEMNSCRQPEADELLHAINFFEEKHNPENLLMRAADVLNLYVERLDSYRFSIIPSDQMLVPFLPGIPDDGCEITFNRETAIVREDVQFITWDHPLMQGLYDLVTSSELGTASVALWPNERLKPGMILVEALLQVDINSPLFRQAAMYLRESHFRIVLMQGNEDDLSAKLPEETLSSLITTAPKSVCRAVIKECRTKIQEKIDQLKTLADRKKEEIIKASLQDLKLSANREIIRLQQLQQRNTVVSQQDIEAKREAFKKIEQAIAQQLQPKISSVRVIVTTENKK